MKRCKYANMESTFSTSIDPKTKKYCEYDIHTDGNVGSHKGMWSKGVGPICAYLYDGNVDEQFKEHGGFFYCDESRCYDCAYYEPIENGKEIKIRKRDPIESRLRHEVFKRDNFICVECGKSKEETILHCDHIIPVSQGGTDELDNLQTLCQACNLAKTNRCWNRKKED